MKFTSPPNPIGWRQCKCPFHHDNTPSASFNVYSGYFMCWGCGLKLQKQAFFQRLGYPIATYNRWTTVISGSGDKLDWESYYANAFNKMHPYIESRGINESTRIKYNIKWTSDGVIVPLIDKFDVPFPSMSGIVVRRFVDTWGRYRYYFNPKFRPVFYPKLRQSYTDTLYFVEGVFGVINMREMGYETYATLGASIRLTQQSRMSYINNKVVVIFDDDYPGITGAIELAMKCKDALIVLPGMQADEATDRVIAHGIKHAVKPHIALDYLRTNLQDY